MKSIHLKLRKSIIGCTEEQRATIVGLGLRRINHTRTLKNTPAIRGMVKKVMHLLDVEEIEAEQA